MYCEPSISGRLVSMALPSRQLHVERAIHQRQAGVHGTAEQAVAWHVWHSSGPPRRHFRRCSLNSLSSLPSLPSSCVCPRDMHHSEGHLAILLLCIASHPSAAVWCRWTPPSTLLIGTSCHPSPSGWRLKLKFRANVCHQMPGKD